MRPEGDVFDAEWRRSCSVKLISRGDAQPLIEKHYLGKWPGVCVLSLGLFRSGKALGVIVFALPPKQTEKRYGGTTWELARLWIDDSVPTNGETWFIGKAIRHIKRSRPDVDFLVSYADPSAGHTGTIYTASNWTRDGRTDDDRKTPRCDYVSGGKKYSRRGHIPKGAPVERVPRVSKARFVYKLPSKGARSNGHRPENPEMA